MKRTRTFEVLPGIWCVCYQRAKSCSYIVMTRPGGIVVDAGPDPSAADLMMGLQEARVGLTSIRALVLTHGHAHASAGAAAFAKRSGTRVLCSESEAPFLRGEREPPLWDRLRGRRIQSVEPSELLSDGDVVEGRLEVLETPGHTKGHLSFYLREERAVITGDALTESSGKLRVDEDETSRASARRCLEGDVRWVLPAHGAPLDDLTEIERIRDDLG